MSPFFTLKVETEISSAHQLVGYIGDCARLHGHNWRIRVEVIAQDLDDIGVAVDFKVLKSLLKEITSPLDHQNLNEIEPFNKINPTAENLAKYIFEEYKKVLNIKGVTLNAIIIYETPRSEVRYGIS